MDDVEVMSARLERFFAEAEPDVADISVLNYEPMIGGYSRVMAQFDLRWRRAGREEVRRLVFRADPPPDRAGFHTNRRTEWDILSHLAASAAVSVPKPHWYCDGRHLGSPAIVMDFIPSTSLLSHISGRDDLGSDAVRLAEVAAAIHGVDTACLPPSVVHPGDSETYLTERIAEWASTERAHPESDPFLRYVGAWLSAHRPPARSAHPHPRRLPERQPGRVAGRRLVGGGLGVRTHRRPPRGPRATSGAWRPSPVLT